jgi:hypothetical protein
MISHTSTGKYKYIFKGTLKLELGQPHGWSPHIPAVSKSEREVAGVAHGAGMARLGEPAATAGDDDWGGKRCVPPALGIGGVRLKDSGDHL